MYDTHRRVRSRRLRHILVAGIAATCLVLAGCGAGQDTQTASQDAAVNGVNVETDTIALRNVFIAVEPDEPQTKRAELHFYAINTGNEQDRLVAIESDAATVTLDADPAKLVMQPETALAAGEPIQQLEVPMAPDQPITAAIELTDGTVESGLTMPFTFVFENAGEVPVTVPFDVWAPGEDVTKGRPLPGGGY